MDAKEVAKKVFAILNGFYNDKVKTGILYIDFETLAMILDTHHATECLTMGYRKYGVYKFNTKFVTYLVTANSTFKNNLDIVIIYDFEAEWVKVCNRESYFNATDLEDHYVCLCSEDLSEEANTEHTHELTSEFVSYMNSKIQEVFSTKEVKKEIPSTVSKIVEAIASTAGCSTEDISCYTIPVKDIANFNVKNKESVDKFVSELVDKIDNVLAYKNKEKVEEKKESCTCSSCTCDENKEVFPNETKGNEFPNNEDDTPIVINESEEFEDSKRFVHLKVHLPVDDLPKFITAIQEEFEFDIDFFMES